MPRGGHSELMELRLGSQPHIGVVWAWHGYGMGVANRITLKVKVHGELVAVLSTYGVTTPCMPSCSQLHYVCLNNRDSEEMCMRERLLEGKEHTNNEKGRGVDTQQNKSHKVSS